jgi:hypothetical protein
VAILVPNSIAPVPFFSPPRQCAGRHHRQSGADRKTHCPVGSQHPQGKQLRLAEAWRIARLLRWSGEGKHRSRNSCPVFMADHPTECDGYFDEATVITLPAVAFRRTAPADASPLSRGVPAS